jgi:glycerol-3-phosphate dehydrogenase (NAD(P)+)
VVKAGVIGCGAWGTTLAKILTENGLQTTLWCHEQTIADEINSRHTNKLLLPGIELPKSLKASVELSETVQNNELIVLVPASRFFKATVEKIKGYLTHQPLILSATKGLEESSNKRMSEILLEVIPELTGNIAVLSGPNISFEIANKKPATTVIASENHETAAKIQKIFNNNYFRVYTNNDVVGTEFGGTLKNIIAIAAGILDGKEIGNNTKSALMVRGIVEMSKLAVAKGAKAETLSGLSGMGDLITTCSSTLSRNHFVGESLASGKTLNDILKNMPAVAEGVDTTKVAHNLAKALKISMPITEEMYQVLYKNKNINQAIEDLMTRDLKPE